ncbi:MAG: IGHMBP2 family helicase [Aquificae bacterium]|nr:IGHMBP2 family helicase [Aquificota bacterium]
MPQLNPYQKEAVEKALKSEDLFLLHGPPGTGKTTTLTEVIKRLAERGEKVLATADSNTAVDNLLERLVKEGVPAVRVGNPVRVLKEVREHSLDYLLEREPAFAEAKKIYEEIEKLKERQRGLLPPEPRFRRGLSDEEILKGAKEGKSLRGLSPSTLSKMARWIELRNRIKELYRKAKEKEKEAVEKVLGGAQVVCTTNASAGSEVLEGFSFDSAVIDEATQATEPSALVPVTKAKRVIMAGDHKQLPPTVLSEKAKPLTYTLFERMLDLYGDARYAMLRVQYRMNRQIADFPNRTFYGGKLITPPSVAERKLPVKRETRSPYADPNHPFVFRHIEGKEERRKGSPSYYNEAEALEAVRAVKDLLSAGVPPQEVGVISPYDEQVRLLEELLKEEGVEVKTVDGFQGREKEAVVLSLVRANREGDIGFLKDYRRLNVSITRPRSKLVVFGHEGTLSSDPIYRSLLEHAKEKGLYIK